MQYRGKYDNIIDKITIFKDYQNLIHNNGFPYQILKLYLPIIQENVNQILKNMVKFSIQINFDNGTETKKTKWVQSTSIYVIIK